MTRCTPLLRRFEVSDAIGTNCDPCRVKGGFNREQILVSFLDRERLRSRPIGDFFRTRQFSARIEGSGKWIMSSEAQGEKTALTSDGFLAVARSWASGRSCLEPMWVWGPAFVPNWASVLRFAGSFLPCVWIQSHDTKDSVRRLTPKH